MCVGREGGLLDGAEGRSGLLIYLVSVSRADLDLYLKIEKKVLQVFSQSNNL